MIEPDSHSKFLLTPRRSYHVKWPFGFTHLDDGDGVAKEILGDYYSELDALLPTMQRCDTGTHSGCLKPNLLTH